MCLKVISGLRPLEPVKQQTGALQACVAGPVAPVSGQPIIVGALMGKRRHRQVNEEAPLKTIISLILFLMPGEVFAHGNHAPISEPAHFLSHSGHIVGAIIAVAALIAFFRKRDEF